MVINKENKEWLTSNVYGLEILNAEIRGLSFVLLRGLTFYAKLRS
jgi:hypothetical protein